MKNKIIALAVLFLCSVGVQAQIDRQVAMVALIQALGGGWTGL